MKNKIVVCLTTIPSRVKYLERTLKSIQNQSLKPSSIELNIPHKYRRSDIGQIELASIPEAFDIYRCEDFGPATKLIPTLERYRSSDTLIIYCDDDRIYHKDWIKRLISTHQANPGCCIFESGADLSYHWHQANKNWLYRLKRLASLGLWKPKNKMHDADIVEGYGGVLVTSQMFDSSVRQIPDCFTFVDDIWFSAKLAQAGIETKWSGVLDHEVSQAVTENGDDIGRLNGSLTVTEFNGRGRKKLDSFAICFAIKNLGVWRQHINMVQLYLNNN
ncbi:hypothetical protein RB2150_17619 [Rhodobacterales bacterium HTCC2150]|nr:hypothetical protein RB2150_17619 [Rhodobacterales bacterium HTCC2150] [Rhodobacteraceae bacterium HTCC2150]